MESGGSYGSTYKLAFIMHEIAKEADRLLQALAFQSRSKFLELNGKFELIYLGSAPSVSKIFTEDDCLREPMFGYTPELDIRNRIYAHYQIDYRKGGAGADDCDAVESDSDATSISDNGERVETVVLSACRTQAMATDWVAWYLTQKKQEWRLLDIELPWIGKALGPGQTFSLTWDFFSGVTWDPIKIEANKMTERLQITAQEWPS